MMKPIKWDGRERTAERISDIMPSGTISWWGGGRGYPREIFIRRIAKNNLRWWKVPKGSFISMNRKGEPCQIRARS